MLSRRVMIGGGAGAAVLAALGYRAWDRGLFSGTSGAAYEPWQEWQGHAGEGARRPLHAAILAASAHNTQPWLFEVDDDSIIIYADRKRNLGSFDPFRREMHLSLGCVVENLTLAASGLGYAARVRVMPGRLDPSPPSTPVAAVQIDLESRGGPDRDPLAAMIAQRHTNRGAYLDRPVSQDVQAALLQQDVGGNVRVALIVEPGMHADFGAIIVEATKRIVADAEMSADSAKWFRTGARDIAEHRDGVTVDASGLSPLMVAAAKLLPDASARQADDFWLAATRDVQVPTAAMFGAILVDDRFDMVQAIAAGQAWQHLHLKATLNGLAAQPLNQPVEMMDRDQMLGKTNQYAKAIAYMADTAGMEPTFVFRLGYPRHAAPPSPRRSLESLLRQTGYG